MPMNTARRLLAGLAVAGAFVAATPLPASADFDLQVDAQDMLVAPDSSAFRTLWISSVTEMVGEMSMVVDSSGLEGAYIELNSIGWNCDALTGTLIKCDATEEFPEGGGV